MSLNLMKRLKGAVVVAALLSAGAANAALYQFTLTGDYSASWQLNATNTPELGAEGVGFLVYDVTGDFPDSLYDVADLSFFNADQGGGLAIDDYYGDAALVLANGPQLYTGNEEGIISFLTGAFSLGAVDGPGTYTLTVTDLDAVPDPGTPGEVPEPASIALMLGGLASLAALRKRRNAN